MDSSATIGDNVYNWTIPSGLAAGTDYKITVTSNADATVSSASGAFAIDPSSFIMVEQPNGGETLVAGVFYEVKWASNAGGDVKIAYSMDGGATYSNEVIASTPNTGSYSWKTPNTTGTQFRVQVSSVQTPSILDASDADFSVTPAAITLVSPNGGEIWAGGAAYEIKWQSNVSEAVTIALHKGSPAVFDSWITPEGTSTPNDGSYNWNIPASQLIGDDYSVVISCSSASGKSARVFTISADPFVQIVSPNGGEVWAKSDSATPLQTRKVKWLSNTNGTVRVQVYRQDSPGTPVVDAQVPNLDREYLTALSSSVPSGYDYFAKVTLIGAAGVEDVSDNEFAILDPYLNWDSERVGDVLAGAVQKIRWDSNIGGSFTIKLLNGGSETTIVSGVPGSEYSWQVPIDTAAGSYTIRVVSDALDTISIDSDAFAISLPTLSVTYPTAGLTFGVGGNIDIKWACPVSESIDMGIALYKAGVLDSVIAANTPNTGSYAWTIPAGKDGLFTIRVYAVDNPLGVGGASGQFTIGTATLNLASPNGGESWVAGDSYQVTWTSNLGGTVTISLTSDNVLNRIIAPGVSNTGSYTWAISRDIPAGTKYKLQIVSDLDASLSDSSFDFFTISSTPYIAVLSPNGGEVWATGTTRDILWDSNAGGTVKVELSANGGTSFSTLASGLANNGRYGWNIPADFAADSDYLVRVASESSLDVSDVSDSPFSIAPLKLEITSPAAGATFSPGAVVPITWASNIGGSMNIELYDGGSLSYVIAAAATDSGLFEWTVPATQAASAAYTIKMTSNSLPTATASSGAFSILAPFIKISAPDGGDEYIVGKHLENHLDFEHRHHRQHRPVPRRLPLPQHRRQRPQLQLWRELLFLEDPVGHQQRAGLGQRLPHQGLLRHSLRQRLQRRDLRHLHQPLHHRHLPQRRRYPLQGQRLPHQMGS